MKPFRYGADPLCILGCACYAANRFLLKHWFDSIFLNNWFNDLWLIPAALPLVLWLQRKWKWRSHDRPPTPGEIVGHLVAWSVICEGIGPWLFPSRAGDPWDIAAYAAGAIAAALWWNRRSHFHSPVAAVP